MTEFEVEIGKQLGILSELKQDILEIKESIKVFDTCYKAQEKKIALIEQDVDSLKKSKISTIERIFMFVGIIFAALMGRFWR